MGFLSFNEKYYKDALERLSGRTLNKSEIYEVKQLKKLLDDLLDEGYTLLSRTLEEKYGAVSGLNKILSAHGEAPFPIRKAIESVEYGDSELDVEEVCALIKDRAQKSAAITDDPFLVDLAKYCDWIPRRQDTAYVFLLRDALLPYLCFDRSGKTDLYPWMINRDFLRKVAGNGLDDLLRLAIYEALEYGVSDYSEFAEFCKPRIRKVLSKHTELKEVLIGLLDGIDKEKILVIESGYCGTIPLALSALDDRVDFRLYTTAPYLYKIYREKIFCERYEDIRSFETLYAHEALMKFSSFKNGRFYVRIATDDEVWERAASEVFSLRALLDRK